MDIHEVTRMIDQFRFYLSNLIDDIQIPDIDPLCYTEREKEFVENLKGYKSDMEKKLHKLGEDEENIFTEWIEDDYWTMKNEIQEMA